MPRLENITFPEGYLMPNIAAILKDEIRRLARKEAKAQADPTKRAVIQYRTELIGLKRLVQEQQKRIAYLAARGEQPTSGTQAEEGPLAGMRFSSRSVRAQRRRSGLSAEDYGRLVGVSALTIYHWEHGKAHPRHAQLAALIGLRGIGKREAARRLNALDKLAARKRRRAR